MGENNFNPSILHFFNSLLLPLSPKLVIEHIDARESGANPELYLQL